MNIPMAYDVLPTSGQQSGGGAMYGAPGQSSQVGQGNEVNNPLLLNEQEQIWQQDMVADGIGHLPVSWYRQTPQQAVWSAYGIINRVICALFNLGLNAGLGYAILKGKDEVGLWQKPDQGENPYSSAAFSDLLATAFLVTFFTCLISTPGIRKAMKEGQTIPVDGEALTQGCWAYTPIRMLGTCTRSLLLALWACAVLGIGTIMFLEVVCAAGGMHGHGSQCSFEQHPYIWFKAVFSAVVAWVIYPLVLLSAINVRTVPPLDLTMFVENQKHRWEAKQAKEMPQPL